jgi:hypothetical protein
MRPSQISLIALVFGFTASLSAQEPTGQSPRESVEISGVLLLNAYYSDDLVNDREVPWLAAPRNPISGERLEALGSTVRQSRIMLRAGAFNVLGGNVEGEVDLDFFGANTDGSRGKPMPRIRRLVGRIEWANAWLLFGQDALPISSLDPSSYSAVSVPGFTGSGNLSRWMPQVRLGLEMGSGLRIGVEAAAVAPRFNNIQDTDSPQPDPAELSKRPFVQGRLLTRWGTDGLEGEVSLGGHYGWYTTGVDSLGLGITKAAAATGRIIFNRMFEFRGEAFRGEALGMLGGGGIDQTLGPNGAPIQTEGGWAQLNVHLSPELEVGGGYGIDNPKNAELDPDFGRKYNVSWEIHGHLNMSPLVIAVEYRRLETTYVDAIYDLQTANHLNLALGYVF